MRPPAEPPADDAWRPHKRKRRGRGRFGVQLRVRNRERASKARSFHDWTPAWKWYDTERRRDEALAALNAKDRCFEWRASPETDAADAPAD